MSYEYFLQAHINQEPQEVSTESILEIFKDSISKKDETFVDLKFDEENSCTVYIDVSESTVNGFMVSRPCSARKLGEYLYKTMLLGNFVFFEPEGKHAIILSAITKNHLPEDMIEALGEPVVAKDMDEFLELYYNNR